jgi:hypothetical protein
MHRLEMHPIFTRIQTLPQLRKFMQWHVFAVWDFMSLVKRLQRELTCVDVPWLPPKDPAAARMINDIVLGEETDEDGCGAHASHFDLYLKAMREIDASTERIDVFLGAMHEGLAVNQALERARVDPAVAAFVDTTITTATKGSLPQVLGSFLYGRENVIPAMFKRLLEGSKIPMASAATLDYYLRRHIDLDGDSHGPAAERLTAQLVRDNPAHRALIVESGLHAVESRMAFWDALDRRLSAAH